MPNASFPTLSVAVAGTGSSANLVASSTGQSIRVWQLLIGATTDTTAQFTYTAAGQAVTVKIPAPQGISTLPFTGAPWAIADVGTAVQFTAASTTTLTAYYSKGVGG